MEVTNKTRMEDAEEYVKPSMEIIEMGEDAIVTSCSTYCSPVCGDDDFPHDPGWDCNND